MFAMGQFYRAGDGRRGPGAVPRCGCPRAAANPAPRTILCRLERAQRAGIYNETNLVEKSPPQGGDITVEWSPARRPLSPREKTPSPLRSGG